MEAAQEILGSLGLLFRGGKVLIGKILQEKYQQIPLIAMAKDLDSGESARFLKKIQRAHRPLLELPFTKEELGAALGRDAVTFVGIDDKKAALALLTKVTRTKGVL